MSAQVDFGYPLWLGYGHLFVTAGAAGLFLISWVQRWALVLRVVIGAVILWSLVGFAIARFGLNANGKLPLPTQNFLPAGAGRVLDLGAGTGRSTAMVLEERAQTSIVALDQFADSYHEHFGAISGQERLLANLRALGIDKRAAIEVGDMRKLAFADGSFDAIVSAYAIDHLNRQGIDSALAEARRVLKPGGQFLMMIITKDLWLRLAFGPLLLHSGTRDAAWWTARLQQAGFVIVEEGHRPATLYLLARKP